MNRHARRLLLVVLWLVVADVFVPPLLQRAEHARYERGGAFRFENSDLFALGPMVRYLREHPHGDRPRAVFLGNSVVFGYGIDAREALPAQFERFARGRRVFNAAVNGQEMGDSLLAGKAIIDSVDTLFVQVIPHHDAARPILGKLLPVSSEDAQRYGLEQFDPIEARLRSILGRVWRLYASNDRLQAAWFGTSTRQFLYLHKRNWIVRRAAPPPISPHISPVNLVSPRNGTGDPTSISQSMVALADVAAAHRKRVVFLHFQRAGDALDPNVAGAFNARYAPHAELVIVDVPPALYSDRQHLTPDGAASVAAALAAHEGLQ